MENEFLIIDYLDGNLNPQQEEAFFQSLSQNDELRTEFKQQIALKSVFTKDLHTFVPSPETTMNLFSKLGMGTGIGVVASTLSNSNQGFFAKLLSFFSPVALKTAGVTLLTSALVFVGLLKFNIIEWYDTENGTVNNSNVLVQNKDINTPTLQEKNVNELDNNQVSKLSELKPKIIERIIPINNYIFTNDTTKLKGIERERAVEFYNDLAYNSKVTKNNILQDNSSDLVNLTNSNIKEWKSDYGIDVVLNPMNYKPLNSPVFHLSSNNFDIPISLEYSNAGYNSVLNNSNEIKINRDYSSLLNSRVGVYYNYNKELQFGLDYKSESFFQEFNIIDNRGSLLTYYQQPEFKVMSGVLRYLPDYLKLDLNYFELSPYIMASYGVDLFGGGNVMRTGLGINLYFSDQFYLQSSFEYSNLTFKQDKVNYNSNKYGVNFGLGWNLGR